MRAPSDFDEKERERRERKKEYDRQYHAANREKRNRRRSQWSAANREKKNAYDRRWRAANWARAILITVRHRAKRSGLDFYLTEDDIVVPAICPVLGIRLKVGGRGFSANSPSVDRFDNNLGYVKGNVRVISYRANELKRNATLSEMEKLVLYMRGDSNAEST